MARTTQPSASDQALAVELALRGEPFAVCVNCGRVVTADRPNRHSIRIVTPWRAGREYYKCYVSTTNETG